MGAGRRQLKNRAAALLLATALPSVALGKESKAVQDTGGWEEKTDENGRVVQQLKIEAPAMTEEDQYGYVMPERYRCDACKAVMFHLSHGLQQKQPKSRRLKQWEYTDAFDDICKTGFEGYGIKLIDGENALSGPGLPREDTLQPGMGAIQMSSENWSKRLGEICRKIVYEQLGEEETYEYFYKKFSAEASGKDASTMSGLSESLCRNELRQCTAGPKPPKVKAEEVKPAKKKKEPKSEKKPKTVDVQPEKKEKKPKTVDVQPGTKEKKPKTVDVQPGSKDDGGKVDAEAFLRDLAVKHGLASDKYVSRRTRAEWEKTFVSIAGRLFNDKSEL